MIGMKWMLFWGKVKNINVYPTVSLTACYCGFMRDGIIVYNCNDHVSIRDKLYR